MANAEQLEILKQGVQVWNEWRQENPHQQIDLFECDLSNVDLRQFNLNHAHCFYSNFTNSNFTGADLSFATFWHSKLDSANFTSARLLGATLKYVEGNGTTFAGANLRDADLSGAEFSHASFINANLFDANCAGTSFINTDFTEANLSRSNFVETNLHQSTLKDCNVFGISIWMVRGTPKEQSGLIITHPYFTAITVDDIYLAQFIHLLITNMHVSNAIDTLTSKVVLILGRFNESQKPILDSIRESLRHLNLVPVLFDFTKPASKDLTGTVETLARMAKFIIADLTSPSSGPHELSSIIPFLRTTPVLPIRLKGTSGYTMFPDYQRSYSWVLPTHEYLDGPSLIAELAEVIAPANAMAERFRNRADAE